MTPSPPWDVTRLLQTWGRGEKALLGELIPLVHGGLCGRAHRRIGRQGLGQAFRTAAAPRAQ
jgi:hypothetical protein